MSIKQGVNNKKIISTSVYNFESYNTEYFLKAALSGGLCCSITHGGLCPVDVVKTRIQLDPVKYNRGLIGGFQQVVAEEGAMALSTGLGATALGYFVQGWFKFGGVEFFKVKFTKSLGDEKAWENRTAIYLAASACAESVADVFLCPFEAARIRAVSDPSFGNGLLDVGRKLVAQEGFLTGLYSGFGPMLFKQVPYTMAKFAVQGKAAEAIYSSLGTNPEKMSGGGNLGVSLGSGVIAGVAAAIISHPADTLMSKVNKAGAGGDGGVFTRLGRIAGEIGFYKLATVGLPARCVMIGSITAFQFGIYDTVASALGAGKFHFHNPKAEGGY
jgi:solute carrier family 25 phosphate transporter 3